MTERIYPLLSSAALVLLLFGGTCLYTLEYSVVAPRQSEHVTSCGSLAPAFLSWRIRRPRDEATDANRLFHIHRAQPTCDEARQAEVGYLILTLAIVLVAGVAMWSSGHPLLEVILGVLLLLGALYFGGASVVDGPIVATAGVSGGACLAAVGTVSKRIRAHLEGA